MSNRGKLNWQALGMAIIFSVTFLAGVGILLPSRAVVHAQSPSPGSSPMLGYFCTTNDANAAVQLAVDVQNDSDHKLNSSEVASLSYQDGQARCLSYADKVTSSGYVGADGYLTIHDATFSIAGAFGLDPYSINYTNTTPFGSLLPIMGSPASTPTPTPYSYSSPTPTPTPSGYYY